MSSSRGSAIPWSLTLATVNEIPVRIHITFFAFLLYIAFEETATGGDVFTRLLFVILIFTCVLLHELGHALTARLFSIKTRDIVLYPFGGVASLLGEGKPKAEFFIAIAGPLVNIVIAGILFPFATIDFNKETLNTFSLVDKLLLANVGLALFNLIPAFPMDGGRILRAVLGLLGSSNATIIASRLSQFICILMGVAALSWGNMIFLLIAVIVFSSAMNELVAEKTRGAAAAYKVSEVMSEIPQLISFTHGTTISRALDTALRSLQPLFPVMHGTSVLGVVSRDLLLEKAALDTNDDYVASIMERDFLTCGPADDLTKTLERMQASGFDYALVLHDEQFAGVLLKEKVVEFLFVHDVRRKAKAQAEESTDDPF